MSNAKLIKAAENFAGVAETLRERANDIVKMVPGFPDSVPEQDEADIREGLRNRAIESFGTLFFLKDGDSYAKLTPADAKKADPKKVASIGAGEAMALTSHELGKLKTTEPNRWEIVSRIRKAVSTTVSNRYGDLVRYANEINQAATGKRAPRPIGALMERTKNALAGIDKMHKTAIKRGDPAAIPAEIIRNAELAYMAKINEYIKTKTK